MQQFLKAMRLAVETENWFGGLFTALAIPDICAALEYRETSGLRYKDWFNRYLKNEYNPDRLSTIEEYIEKMDFLSPFSSEQLAATKAMLISSKLWPLSNTTSEVAFTAEDCYKFRCKCLHQGVWEGKNKRKIDFSPPPKEGITIHKCLHQDTYIIAIDVFCEDVI